MKRSITAVAVVALGMSLLGACGSDDDTKGASDCADSENAKTSLTIGAQDFDESYILAEIFKQGLAKHCFKTSVKKLGASAYRPAELEAFSQNAINFAPEYVASMLEELNSKKGEATGDVDATLEKLATYLPAKGLAALEASDAVDTNGFVVTKETAQKYNLKTLSDLAARGKEMRLGAPSNCETNPFCLPGLKTTYGLDLSGKFLSLGSGQPIADALLSTDASNKIDVGVLFSTSAIIGDKGFVLLDDDKHMLAADNIVPVLKRELADNDELVEYANEITAKLTTAKATAMNKRYTVDKEDAAVIAKDFLTDEGLL